MVTKDVFAGVWEQRRGLLVLIYSTATIRSLPTPLQVRPVFHVL